MSGVCALVECAGQAEVRGERRLEMGDLADPVAGEADHDDPRDGEAAGHGVADPACVLTAAALDLLA
jgi:hypothetical protein